MGRGKAVDQNLIHIYKIATSTPSCQVTACLRVTSSSAVVMTPAVASCLHSATISLFPHPLLCLTKISGPLTSLLPFPTALLPCAYKSVSVDASFSGHV